MKKESIIYFIFFAVGFLAFYNWPVLNPSNLASAVIGGIGASIFWFFVESVLKYWRCISSGKGGK